jgi:predicted P-loop ATPase
MIKHEYAPAGGCYWTETDTIGIRKYLNDKMGVDFGTDMLYDAILQYAQCRGINPIKRYFESLKWDGKRRIEYLFSHYGNSSDNQKYSEFLANCSSDMPLM